MTSAGPQIIQETNITAEGGDGSLSACKSLVIHLRFHQNENLLKFSRRRRLDDVLTKSHMRRTLARENFTSARRRRAISLSMLKVPNDYPLSPEKIKVTDDMLSDYCKEIKNKFGISSGNVHKLVTSLNDKEKYVLHEESLKLYLSLGLRLKEVYRVLQFKEKPWLKEYIDFNTEKRKNAKNSFEKDFYKLMNNSVFGKTTENIRKRSNIYLETDSDHFLRQTAKPTFVGCKIFNENLVAVNMKKSKLKLDKPSYVGMCILDLSKTLMYDFHYNYIKKKYGDRAKLLFTDTDSLCYHIKTEDVYEDLYHDKGLFDNSDCPKSSKFFFG